MKICGNKDCAACIDKVEWEDNTSTCPICGGYEFKIVRKSEVPIVKIENAELNLEDYEILCDKAHPISISRKLTPHFINIKKTEHKVIEDISHRNMIIQAPVEEKLPEPIEVVSPIEPIEEKSPRIKELEELIKSKPLETIIPEPQRKLDSIYKINIAKTESQLPNIFNKYFNILKERIEANLTPIRALSVALIIIFTIIILVILFNGMDTTPTTVITTSINATPNP